MLTKKEGEAFYISCSDGIVEVFINRTGGSTVKLAMRATNPKIDFHRDVERLRRSLGSWVRFNQEEGNGSGAV